MGRDDEMLAVAALTVEAALDRLGHDRAGRLEMQMALSVILRGIHYAHSRGPTEVRFTLEGDVHRLAALFSEYQRPLDALRRMRKRKR